MIESYLLKVEAVYAALDTLPHNHQSVFYLQCHLRDLFEEVKAEFYDQDVWKRLE